MTVADQAVGATVSIGVASGEPGADVMVMIAAADRALYKAKENGRNRVELADECPSAPPRDDRRDDRRPPSGADRRRRRWRRERHRPRRTGRASRPQKSRTVRFADS